MRIDCSPANPTTHAYIMKSGGIEHFTGNNKSAPKLNGLPLKVNTVHSNDTNRNHTNKTRATLTGSLQRRVELIYTPVASDFHNLFVVPQNKWLSGVGGYNLPAVDFFTAPAANLNRFISTVAINGGIANNSNYVVKRNNDERAQNSAKPKNESGDGSGRKSPLRIFSAQSPAPRLSTTSTASTNAVHGSCFKTAQPPNTEDVSLASKQNLRSSTSDGLTQKSFNAQRRLSLRKPPTAIRRDIRQWSLRQSTVNATIATLLREDVRPINGMIKTYNNPRRKFARPYSAKTVFFYKDGDEYFTGVRVPVTKKRYRCINALLDRLNEIIYLPYGVRQLHTPYGRTIIRSIDELKHLGKYVASSGRQPRGLDLAALERRKRERESNVARAAQRPPVASTPQQHWKRAPPPTFGYSTTDTKGSTAMSLLSSDAAARFRSEKLDGASRLSYLPITKQMFFILNGHPSCIYRTVLNPLRRNNDFDALLEEISDGLRAPIFRLFSYDGKRLYNIQQLMDLKEARVLAVPRHQRLILPNENSLPLLPPIIAWTKTTTVTTVTASKSRPIVSKRCFSTASTMSNVSRIQRFNDPKTLDDSTLTRRPIHLSPWRGGERISPLRTSTQALQPLRSVPLSKISRPVSDASPEATNFSENGASNSNFSNHTNTMDNNSGRLKSILNLSDDNIIGPGSTPPHDFVNAASAPRHQMRKRRSLSGPTKGFVQSPPPSRILTKIFRSKSFRRPERTSPSRQPRADASAVLPKGVEHLRRRLTHSKSQDTTPRHHRAATPPLANALVQSRIRTRFQAAQSIDVDITKNGHNDREYKEDDEDDDYPKHDELKDTFFRHHRDSDSVPNDEKNGGDIENLENQENLSTKYSKDNAQDRGYDNGDSEDFEEFDGISVHSHKHLDQVDEIENEEKEFELIEAEHLANLNETQTSTQRIHTINEEDDTSPNYAKRQASFQLASSASTGDSETGMLPITKAITISFSAATVIQRHVRGFLTRKKLKSLRFYEDVDIICVGVSKQKKIKDHCINDGNDSAIGNKNGTAVDEENVHDRLVSPPTTVLTAPIPVVASPGSEMLDGETHVSIADTGADRFSVSSQYIKTTYTYTITIKTGNRWAADTEADLHIVLYSDAAQSHRILLRQECVNWLQSSQPKFRQNQTDSFRVELPSRLGVIEKIVVSHEHSGYGAGIFIERVLVSEESEDDVTTAGQDDDADQNGLLDAASVQLGGYDCNGARQFLFLCNKWLDSGQVDGKLERSFRLSAFCYIHLANSKRRTKGRWEFIFNSGLSNGLGGTTSNLRIIGYGIHGQSTTSNIYDTRMKEVPSESLIQVDFGNIGDLLKVRVEIDGTGASPDYFLNFLAMRDLDTEERFVIMCGKWLRWKSSVRGAQPFRELLAFHYGVEPLPLITYEGKLRVMPSRLKCFDEPVQMEFHGDLGETGVFSVPLSVNSPHDDSVDTVSLESLKNDSPEDKKIEIAFKIEAVSIERVYGARIFFRPTKLGAQLFEGFYTLQKMFECESTTSDWLVSSVVLRESHHTPYRYVFTRRKLLPLQNQQQKNAAGGDPYIMDFVNSEMEGVPTRLRKSLRGHRGASNWVLSMLLGAGSTLLPDIVLCDECGEKALEMRVLDAAPVDDIISYQLKTNKDTALRKVRVSADGVKCLNINQNGKATTAGDGKFVAIRKMRLCDTVNGDELRFPNADIELGPKSVYEFSVIWPDYPPVPIVIFTVHIVTGQAIPRDGGLSVCLNLRGKFGEVGQRTLATATANSRNFFQRDSESAFEFEAVSIGELKSAELSVNSKHEKFVWECRQLVVDDSFSQNRYVFKFSKLFSENHKSETAKVL